MTGADPGTRTWKEASFPWPGIGVPEALLLCDLHVTGWEARGLEGRGSHPAKGQDPKALGGGGGLRVSGQPARVGWGSPGCGRRAQVMPGQRPFLTGPISPAASLVGLSGPSSTHTASASRSKAVRHWTRTGPASSSPTTRASWT